MQIYYVNKNAQSYPEDGEHEVHTVDCHKLPLPSNRIDLGYCFNCQEAIRKAKAYYDNVDGCAICCSACHLR